MKKNNTTISDETQQQAIQVAKATQRPGQTKEQTKLIAQGIAKGIAEYKKQHKQKARQADKAKKRNVKAKQTQVESPELEVATKSEHASSTLPWLLLVISWIGFAAYLAMQA